MGHHLPQINLFSYHTHTTTGHLTSDPKTLQLNIHLHISLSLSNGVGVAPNRSIERGKNQTEDKRGDIVEAAVKYNISVVMHTDGIFWPGARIHTQ